MVIAIESKKVSNKTPYETGIKDTLRKVIFLKICCDNNYYNLCSPIQQDEKKLPLTSPPPPFLQSKF